MTSFHFEDFEETLYASKLLPQSKKIRKAKTALSVVQSSPSVNSSHETEDSDCEGSTVNMRTCSFTVDEKKEIVELLKDFLIKNLELPTNTKKANSLTNWISFLDQLGNKKFRVFLKKFVTPYRPDLDLNDRRIRSQVKRNIARWLKSDGVPERRGDPLLPQNELPRFKEIAFAIIQRMESRNLEDFRKEILPHLKVIREQNNLKFNDNMLKKHKWSKFLQQNPDLRAMWERLPRTKPKKDSEGKTVQHSNVSPSNCSTFASFADKFVPFIPEAMTIVENKIESGVQNEQDFEFANVEFDFDLFGNHLWNAHEDISSFYSHRWFYPDFLHRPREAQDFAGGFLKEWRERSIIFNNSFDLFQ
jgi:hypothetical protein